MEQEKGAGEGEIGQVFWHHQIDSEKILGLHSH